MTTVGKYGSLCLAIVLGYTRGVVVNDASEMVKIKHSQIINLKSFEVPAGETLQLTNLQPGTVVEIDGTITFGYQEWKGPLIRITGEKITLVGKKGSLIDCQGERWWDGKGSNGGKIKPKFFELTLNDSTVTGLHVKNTPVHAFSVKNCSNVNITDMRLDNSDGDIKGGHNTDGFDVNSQKVRISNCWIHNQDDCLAINSGSDLVFENNVCIGGHGISIGSIGFRNSNIVDRVNVKDCKIIDSTNGVRIKAKTNATGWVNNVMFEDIVLKNITSYGVLIHTNYQNAERNMEDDPTPGVPITNLKLINVRGTVHQTGTNVYVAVANASNWTWENVDIVGGQVVRECQGLPFNVSVPCGKLE